MITLSVDIHGTEKKGLLVSRLIRFDRTAAVVSDRRESESVSLANALQ